MPHKPLPAPRQPCLSLAQALGYSVTSVPPDQGRDPAALSSALAAGKAVAEEAGPGPRASPQPGCCDWGERSAPHIPYDSVSANNSLPTALFYYFTAQFFLKFYGISLEPPEGDTAPFPEVK